MSAAPFIVIDGPDGSGKGTQTKLLVERLRKEGQHIEHISFPRYGNPEAFFIEQYLTGKYGTTAEVGAKRASIFFAVERFHVSFEIHRLLAEGTTIISDRYVSANKGHQMAKIADPMERKAFLDWLNDLEYGIMGIPKPDFTILLHVPSEIAYDLIANKDARGYLDGKKRDIHEADASHLKAAERAYLELPTLDRVENWQKLECAQDGKLLPIETIHERLYSLVKQRLTG
jgi:dTMP kinase